MQDYKNRMKLLSYLSKISETKLFVIGRLTFFITSKKIILYYKQNKDILKSVELEYDFKKIGESKTDGFKKLKNMIENFVLDCYYYHEYDGKPMKLQDLAELLGIKSNGMENQITRIIGSIMRQLKYRHPDINCKSAKTFRYIVELLAIDG